MRYLYLTILYLLLNSSVYTQNKYRTNGNTSFSKVSNWQTSIANSWINAVKIPDYTNDSIIISMGDTVFIDSEITIDQTQVDSGAVLINTYSKSQGIGNSFTLNDGKGYDLIIKNGGKYIHDMKQFSALPGGNGSILVEGTIEIKNDVDGGCADYYANDADLNFSNRIVWNTNAIFCWNTSGIFSTANKIYFPNVNKNTVPIIHYKGSAILLGAKTQTIINGILEIGIGKIMNWQYSGNKTIRNGIRNFGTLNQRENCGAIILSGSNVEILSKGEIFLNNNSGLILGSQEIHDSILLRSDLKTTSGTVTIAPHTTIINNLFSFIHSGDFKTKEDVYFNLIHENGIDAVIKASGDISFSNSNHFRFVGSGNQFCGTIFPDTVSSLEINNMNMVSFAKCLVVLDSIKLYSGIANIGSDTLIINNNDTNALITKENSFIIGTLKRKTKPQGNYLFPIGNLTHKHFASVNLVNSLGLSELTVSYNPELDNLNRIPNLPIQDGLFESFTNCGYWTIKPNTDYNNALYSIQLSTSEIFTESFTGDIQEYGIIKRMSNQHLWGDCSQGINKKTTISNSLLVVCNDSPVWLF
ncbi:MAG: hypothetical protein IPO21_18065 [Bacteroidales bacterium]|nr:hypothetical protein [Bacteroidales bacterium]